MKSKLSKTISWLIVFTILLSLFPQIVLANDEASVQKVDVYVQLGLDVPQKISILGGKIADQLSAIEALVPKAKKSSFEKAVVVVSEAGGTPVEVEISAVEVTEENNVIYYGLDDYDGSSGIVLKETQKIVLYYKTTYSLTYVCEGVDGGSGNIGNSPTTLTAGEELHIAFFPDDNCYPLSVVMTGKDQIEKDYSSKISNNQVVIPAKDITQDATIKVVFKKASSYQINSGQISNGLFCPTCSKILSDQHAVTDSQYAGVTVENGAAVVQTGKNVLIPLYSDINYGVGTTRWEMNNLKINNEDVRVPANLTVGVEYQTILKNGTIVKVVYQGTSRCNTGACRHDAGIGNNRKVYYVYLEGVTTDYKVEANFKNTKRQEIVFKGLEGIESTGAALEHVKYKAGLPNIGNHYYYTLYEDYVNNVYTYNDTASVHVNMYVYKVKSGYNPYTVNVQGVNTGLMNDEDDITGPSGHTVNLGYTIEEMAALAKSGSNYRHLDGTTGTDSHWNDKEIGGRGNAFVSKSLSEGYQFGFFLADPSGEINNNQMIYLNASKYKYSVQYDVNGGLGHIEDTKRYTIGEQMYIASNAPTKTGYLFQGWQIVDEEGNAVNNTVYNRNQAFSFNADAVKYAFGNEKSDTGLGLSFKAVWKKMSDIGELNTYTISYYREVKKNESGAIIRDGKYYIEYFQKNTFSGVIGSQILALDDHTLDVSEVNWKRYIFNENLSCLNILELQATTEEDWEKKNSLYYFFDLIDLGSLKIENNVTGTFSDITKAFEYSVTINDSTVIDSEFTITGGSDSRNPTSIKNNTPTILYLKHGEVIHIEELSASTSYTITENKDDYTVSISVLYGSLGQEAEATIVDNVITGTLKQDEEAQDLIISFTNHLDYKNINTGIYLNGMPYLGIILIVLSAALSKIKSKRKSDGDLLFIKE